MQLKNSLNPFPFTNPFNCIFSIALQANELIQKVNFKDQWNVLIIEFAVSNKQCLNDLIQLSHIFLWFLKLLYSIVLK